MHTHTHTHIYMYICLSSTATIIIIIVVWPLMLGNISTLINVLFQLLRKTKKKSDLCFIRQLYGQTARHLTLFIHVHEPFHCCQLYTMKVCVITTKLPKAFKILNISVSGQVLSRNSLNKSCRLQGIWTNY